VFVLSLPAHVRGGDDAVVPDSSAPTSPDTQTPSTGWDQTTPAEDPDPESPPPESENDLAPHSNLRAQADPPVPEVKDPDAPPPVKDPRKGLPEDVSQWSRFDIINYHRDVIHNRSTPDDIDNYSLFSGGLILVTVGSQIFGNPADQMFWPYAEVQQVVARHWALGLMSTIYGYSTYQDYGAMLTGTFFLDKAYHGFNATLGVGVGSATNGVDSGLAHAVKLTLGGQWFIFKPVNLGIEAGIEHFMFYATTGMPNSTILFLPVAQIKVGFAF
jgi:hypothetical protein